MAAKFSKLRIVLASEARMKEWANEIKEGEKQLTEVETFNYRTLKPSNGGLFCCKIFGPVNDFECLCGRYKGMRYSGLVCDKCGVQVTRSSVRRERMGYISLPVSIVHPWFFKSTGNKIGELVDIPLKDLKRILNLELYIVLSPGATSFKFKDIITENQYEESVLEDGFEALTGASALYQIISKMDIDVEIIRLIELIKNTSSTLLKQKYKNSLKLFKNFKKSGLRPELMILNCIPVLPPGLRPLVELDVGQFVSADLNELYRNVLYRSKRLEAFMNNQICLQIILNHEIRLLQDAINNLLGPKREVVNLNSNEKKYKSLEERIKGKEGSFRKSMLGKRVDFSGRSVVVVDPDCGLDECSIPKEMALEIFKPIIMAELKKGGFSNASRNSKRILEQRKNEVWDILEYIISSSNQYVLLNRAPTLHKIGIMAFKIKLWKHKAIGSNPLVCPSFNLDFDGDQQAVHSMQSEEAKAEAVMLMTPSKNLGSVGTGGLNVGAFKDMAFGIYSLTSENGITINKCFSSLREIEKAIYFKKIGLNDSVEFYLESEKKVHRTTAGRVIFYSIIPENVIEFNEINCVVKSVDVKKIMQKVRLVKGDKTLAKFADRIKEIGFEYAYKYTGSIGKNDFLEVKKNSSRISETIQKQVEIGDQLNEGFITETEMKKKSIAFWNKLIDDAKKELEGEIAKNPMNPTVMIMNSGARGSVSSMLQIIFMKGNVVDISGAVTAPVWNGHQKGLTPLQYFILAHGARKGCTDVALKTAESGYLTRRLVDMAHSCIVKSIDCFTEKYFVAKNFFREGVLKKSVFEIIEGRVAAKNIHHPQTKDTLVEKGTLLTNDEVQILKDNNIVEVPVRSPVFCELKEGVCIACYGSDLSCKESFVNLGEAVGVVAAQSIGEPGTQLTMGSYHKGGVAGFRQMHASAITPFAGKVIFEHSKIFLNQSSKNICLSQDMIIYIKNDNNMSVADFTIPYGAEIFVKDGDEVSEGSTLAVWTEDKPIIAEFDGKCEISNMIKGVSYEDLWDDGKKLKLTIKSRIVPTIKLIGEDQRSFFVPGNTIMIVENGQKVKKGDTLAYIRGNMESIDIVGGLQKVISILECRDPKKIASLAPLDGLVEVIKDKRGRDFIKIVGETGEIVEIAVKDVSIFVQNNQRVKKGDVLTSGQLTMQDILDTRGLEALFLYFVKEVQHV